MLALYDSAPNFCPNCGNPAAHKRDPWGSINVKLRNSYICDCRLVYQVVRIDLLLAAAECSEGDLVQKAALAMKQSERTNTAKQQGPV